MPEGDTIYRLGRRLNGALADRTLARGELRVPRHASSDLAGLRVLEVATYGKHLLTRFDSGATLHTHLRMSGSWTVVGAGKRLPTRHADEIRVLLAVSAGPTAYGVNLPVVDLLASRDEREVIGHLGPDPLRPDWDAAEAVRRLAAEPARPLAPALLDQRVLAGLGNLWANELCFLRGHYPWTAVGDVDLERVVALAARALKISATVPGMYQVTTGNRRRGEQHWVAGRAGRPCLRCGTTIRVRAETAEQRRTWWCPSCQPESGKQPVDYERGGRGKKNATRRW